MTETATNFIAGRSVLSAGGSFTPINPATGRSQGLAYPESTTTDVDVAVEAAIAAGRSWRTTAPAHRASIVLALADLLESHADQFVESIVQDMGKTEAEARGEVVRSAAEARFTATEALRPTGVTMPSVRSRTTVRTIRQPLGVIAAITPWNFPIVAPVRKIAPALVYGCTVVLKPSAQSPAAADLLARLAHKAGVPDGVLNVVHGTGAVVGDALVNHAGVDGISFTGSTQVGTKVGLAAAQRHAPTQLELGGKNAAVVVHARDLQEVARQIVSAAFQVSGQRCTAISRVIVLAGQGSELVEHLCRQTRAIHVGAPTAAETAMGPLVSARQLDTTIGYVQDAVVAGAKVETGGTSPAGDLEEGFFFNPTVISGVLPSSPLATEEVFGPVLAVIEVDDLEQAIEVHNETQYGLAASLFCDDPTVIEEFVDRAEVGMVHINHGTNSDPHVPFGGIKASGSGAFSIGSTNQDFFTQLKVIYQQY